MPAAEEQVDSNGIISGGWRVYAGLDTNETAK
jgi:hypothetical protein